MKKFYKMVTTAEKAGQFEIHLDGRPVKTPGGCVLSAPNKALAESLVREWADQQETIKPETMPLTQILTTGADREASQRAALEQAALAYLNTDLLCYRADIPAAVGTAQAEAWDPWLKWFKERFGFALATTCGLQALRHETEAERTVGTYISGLDEYRFNILQLVTSISGSLVLAIAFTEQVITPEQLFDAVHVEESYKAAIYNEEKYGFAPDIEKKRAAMMRDLKAAAHLLELL